MDLSMIPFSTSIVTLLTSSFLVLAGNTGFPIVLRVGLWAALKVFPAHNHWKEWREIVTFILKYPRRVYTHIFPARHTRLLFFLLLLMNGFEWIALELLNINNPVIDNVPTKFRILDGYFQTAMTRSAGYVVWSISSLRIGIQTIYLASE